MMSRFQLAIAFLVLFEARTNAQARNEQEQVTRRILAAWTETNKSVRTIKCQATVESFFPRGSMTIEHNRGKKPAEQLREEIPPDDVRSVDGTMLWALDLSTPRIRKQLKALTRQFYHDKPPQLLREHSIHIFADNKYRLFHPRSDNWTAADREDARAHQDAIFYEDRAYEFLLDFLDLPLFWASGSVSGKLLLPSRMKLLDAENQWTYVGQAELRGEKCHVLTVPNQDDKSSVLEFWVGEGGGYPIRLCKAKRGEGKDWQIDADYRDSNGTSALASWSYSGYDLSWPQRLTHSITFRVTELSINQAIPDELFDHRPKVGMVVLEAKELAIAKVAPDGSLVPWTPGSESRRRWLLVAAGSAIVLAIAIGIVLTRRRAAKRKLTMK